MVADRNNEHRRPEDKESVHGATISIPIPASDANLYRYEATDSVLHVLADDPYGAYTIRELGRLTGFSHPAVINAVDVLERNDLVTANVTGNRKNVEINRNRLRTPDNPVLRVPQPEFHAPVRGAIDRLRDELAAVEGIVVFGSVARGTADRRSDVDLWVLVRSDRATNQRRANDLAKRLSEEPFDGDRYEFQILVESVGSALDVSDRLADVVGTGITLYETETLRRFTREITSNIE